MTARAWSPYLVGAGIGVLSWLTFYFADKPIGASSFYATLAGLRRQAGRAQAHRVAEVLPKQSAAGGLGLRLRHLHRSSAASSRRGRAARFATNGCTRCGWIASATASCLRGVIGFAGGVLMAFGARLAGGCTSGHGISGTLQLNAGSWLTVICMFIGGIATAMLLYTVL